MPTAAAVMMMVVSQQRVRARRRPEPQRQSLEEKHDINNTLTSQQIRPNL